MIDEKWMIDETINTCCTHCTIRVKEFLTRARSMEIRNPEGFWGGCFES